jgi:hypothetical protein
MLDAHTLTRSAASAATKLNHKGHKGHKESTRNLTVSFVRFVAFVVKKNLRGCDSFSRVILYSYFYSDSILKHLQGK